MLRKTIVFAKAETTGCAGCVGSPQPQPHPSTKAVGLQFLACAPSYASLMSLVLVCRVDSPSLPGSTNDPDRETKCTPSCDKAVETGLCSVTVPNHGSCAASLGSPMMLVHLVMHTVVTLLKHDAPEP